MERKKYIYGFFIMVLLMSVVFAEPYPRRFSAGDVGEKSEWLGKEKPEIEGNLPDRWLAPDKAKHFLAGTFITVFAYETAYRRFDKPEKGSRGIAISSGMFISVIKEIIDSRSPGNHFCLKDLTADILGITAGLWLVRFD